MVKYIRILIEGRMEMKKLLIHGLCLLIGHKRKIEVFFEKDGLQFRKHTCERCHYPMKVEYN